MIRRRRQCQHCRHVWFTLEVPDVLIRGLPGLITTMKQAQTGMGRSIQALEETRAWIEPKF